MSANTRRRAIGAEAGGERQTLRERMAELERLLATQRAQLEERIVGQEARLAAQQAEIEHLRAARAQAAPLSLPKQSRSRHTGAADAAPGRSSGRRASRRGLLKLGGAAAVAGAAAAAAGLMEPHAAYALPVPTNGNFILGVSNDADARTTLTNTAGANPSVLLQVDGTAGVGPAFPKTALKAVATGSASIAVLGVSDTGIGVAAVGGGISLAAAGSGRFQQNFQPFVGAPTSGSYEAGEQIRDLNGDLWICVAGNGTDAGKWRKVDAPQLGYTGGALNLLPVPIRLLDTRAGAPVGFSLPGAPIPYHGTLQMQASNLTFQGQSIPAGATAVFGNLVVALAPHVNPGDGSSLICWPNGQPRPAAVNIVYNPGDQQGEYTSTFTLVAIGTSNFVNIYSQPINAGVVVDVIFDAFGFVM